MTSITLNCPVEIGGERITSVDLREPNGRGMIALSMHMPALIALAEQTEAGERFTPDKATFEALVAIAGVLTGVGVEAAGDFAFRDIVRIVNEGRDFLEPALAGETPPIGASPQPSSLPS